MINLKALVVDDSRLARQHITQLLVRQGYEVVEARHGDEALSMLATAGASIGLVFLDLEMPVLDGPTTLALMRARGLSTPVVLVTSCTDVSKVGECLKQGVEDYLLKPVHETSLMELARKVLGAPSRKAGVDEVTTPSLNVLFLDPSEKASARFREILPASVGLEHCIDIDWALAHLEEHDFQKVVISAKPSGSAHVVALNRIRDLCTTEQVYVAYLRRETNPVERAYEEGFDGCLLKPFSQSQIQEFVGHEVALGKVAERKDAIVILHPPSDAKALVTDYLSALGLELGRMLEEIASECSEKAVIDIRMLPDFEHFDLFLDTCVMSSEELGLELGLLSGAGQLSELSAQRAWRDAKIFGSESTASAWIAA